MVVVEGRPVVVLSGETTLPKPEIESESTGRTALIVLEMATNSNLISHAIPGASSRLRD